MVEYIENCIRSRLLFIRVLYVCLVFVQCSGGAQQHNLQTFGRGWPFHNTLHISFQQANIKTREHYKNRIFCEIIREVNGKRLSRYHPENMILPGETAPRGDTARREDWL